jgi:hypothetical protein
MIAGVRRASSTRRALAVSASVIAERSGMELRLLCRRVAGWT